MKILAVSNLYPPHHIGGYELGCQTVVDALTARGHRVEVLTSTFNRDRSTPEAGIHRWLHSGFGMTKASRTASFIHVLAREVRNVLAFRRAIRQVQPDAVYFWNLTNTSKNAPSWAAQQGSAIAYYISDHWLADLGDDPWIRFWSGPPSGPLSALVKMSARWKVRLLALVTGGRIDIRPKRQPPMGARLQFCSSFMEATTRNRGVRTDGSKVIHWGVDPSLQPPRQIDTVRNWLYVGQIAPHKGVATAIRAFGMLAERNPEVRLTVVGSPGPDPDHVAYAEQMKELAQTSIPDGQVTFLPRVSRQKLVELLAIHHGLIFPSEWEEPFSITLLEAMAAGLVVVATPTGGSAEVLKDGRNGLVFPPGDVAGCARELTRLTEDGALADELATNARMDIEQRFSLDAMVDAIEKDLISLIERST